jgi:hypothetical protein
VDESKRCHAENHNAPFRIPASYDMALKIATDRGWERGLGGVSVGTGSVLISISSAMKVAS